jgi:hypothetical protein
MSDQSKKTLAQIRIDNKNLQQFIVCQILTIFLVVDLKTWLIIVN